MYHVFTFSYAKTKKTIEKAPTVVLCWYKTEQETFEINRCFSEKIKDYPKIGTVKTKTTSNSKRTKNF